MSQIGVSSFVGSG